MPSLAINTSSTTEAVAIISGKKVLNEISWKGNTDESKKLLPAIMHALKSARLGTVQIAFKKLKRIIVVSGPGPFSALRIGVTVANSFARALNIPIFEIDTEKFWKARLPVGIPARSAILLLHAGGNFINGAETVEKILEKLKREKHSKRSKHDGQKRCAKNLFFFGDITKNEMLEFRRCKLTGWRFIPEKQLKTFGEAVAGLKLSAFKKKKLAIPRYWKPPSIGSSK